MTSKESGDRLYEKMEEYQVDVPDRGGSASNGKYGCAGGRAGEVLIRDGSVWMESGIGRKRI